MHTGIREWVLALAVHHHAVDEWSFPSLLGDLSTAPSGTPPTTSSWMSAMTAAGGAPAHPKAVMASWAYVNVRLSTPGPLKQEICLQEASPSPYDS